MPDDTINLVTNERLDNDFPYSVLAPMEEYFTHIFGSAYEVNSDPGAVRIPDDVHGNMDQTLDWWSKQGYTATDKNLLVVRKKSYSRNGQAFLNGKSAVVAVKDGLAYIEPPSEDPDMIGKRPTTGYADNMQMSGALHEVGHLYGNSHDSATKDYPEDGYVDNHNTVNYFTPGATSYGGDYSSQRNSCGYKSSYSYFNESRFAEGYLYCAVSKGNFPHIPKETYSIEDVNNL